MISFLRHLPSFVIALSIAINLGSDRILFSTQGLRIVRPRNTADSNPICDPINTRTMAKKTGLKIIPAAIVTNEASVLLWTWLERIHIKDDKCKYLVP